MNLKRILKGVAILAATFLLAPTANAGCLADITQDELTAWMQNVNAQFDAAGVGYNIEAIEFFTIGQGRPSNRIHAQPFRWVAGDARRLAGVFAPPNDISHHSDTDNSPTSIGSFPLAEIDSAMNTWDSTKCLKKVNAIPNPTFGSAIPNTVFGDTTIFDEFFCPIGDSGGPADGFPFASDIVHAGWYPASCFGPGTLAFSITFIFGGGSPFVPSDINGDNRLDTALNEVYYNDAFGTLFPGSPWATGAAALPAIDVETVAFHEAGHSLEIGHFGPPPSAIMNPIYAGPQTTPAPADKAGMCSVWGSWPK